MSDTVTLPIRRKAACDVLVIGGGTTGIAAALSAARNGARTILAESSGFLGGNATAVTSWMGFHSPSGEKAVEGIALELVRRIREHGGATPLYPDPICGSLVVVNPGFLKIVSAGILEEAGVETLLHTRFATVHKEGNSIARAFLLGGEGIIEVVCKGAIDCTESGVLLREAGERLIRGRTSDGKVQVSSWTFETGNIDFTELFAYFERNPDEIRPFPLTDSAAHYRQIRTQEAFVAGAFTALVAKARQEGFLLPRTNLPGVFHPGSGKFMTVATRVEGADSSSAAAHTRAEFEGMRQVERYLEFMRRYVPGFRNCTLEGTNASIGIRESSHLDGVYTLTGTDLLAGRFFEDAVALGGYHLDIHSPDHGGIESDMPPLYMIPYRSLLPRRTANLLAAGRVISATHEAQASTRVIPISMAIGEAAGAAAAIAAREHVPVQEIDPELLRNALRRAGALLDRKLEKAL